jgi:predicted dehydrogenase
MRVKYFEKDAAPSWYKPYTEKTIPLQRSDPLALQIEHFAAVIRGAAQPLVSGRDGLQNLRVTDAIAEAAKSGSVVDVDHE